MPLTSPTDSSLSNVAKARLKAAAERQYAEEYPHVPRAEAAVDHREPDDSIVCPTCVGRGRVQRVEIRIGALLWRARQDKRLTQPQVAAELGVTQATISRLEREGVRGRQQVDSHNFSPRVFACNIMAPTENSAFPPLSVGLRPGSREHMDFLPATRNLE